MNIMRVVLLSLGLLSLTGCGTLNSKFDCNSPVGVSCRPLSEVDKMEVRGDFNSASNALLDKSMGTDSHEIIVNGGSDDLRTNIPLRRGEKIVKVWVAPFEDTQGNYHEEHNIYTVVGSNHWRQAENLYLASEEEV